MLILRRIIFYLFLLIYLILCPALLLYASGYIIDPFTREVERTGLIHLSSLPPGATIYLEHSRFIRKTPATIDQLRPGSYRVTLTLPGYREWTQAVRVKPGKAAAFEKVLLLPQYFPVQTPIQGNFKQIYPLPGTDFILVAQDNYLGSIQLYNFKNERAAPFLDPVSPWYKFPVLSLSHQENSRSFMVYGGGLWERKYLWVTLKGDAPAIVDITRFFSKDPLLIEWDPLNTKELFAVYSNYIDRVDIASGLVYPRDIDAVKGVGFHNNRVYLMTADNRFLRYGRDKTKAEPFLESSHFARPLLDTNIFYHITAPDDDSLFLQGEDGSLLANHPPYQIMEKGVIGMKFHERSRTLMYWTSSSVMLADIDETMTANINALAVKTIFGEGQDIKQCFWSGDAFHIVCNDNDRVYLIETEPQGSDHNEFITQIRKGSSIFFSNEAGDLYFLDEQGGFQKIQLIPKESVVDQLLNKGA